MDSAIAADPEWMEVDRFFEQKDRAYAKAYLEEQAKLERFHEQCREGIHACRVQHTAFAHLDEHLSKVLSEVETNTLEQGRLQRQERHAVETKLEKIGDKSLAEARGVLAEERESRKGGQEYTEQVCNEICHLYNDLEQAKNYRVQKSGRLMEVVTDKLDEIKVAISAEKKIREESTHTLLDLFGQMGTKMQTEIDAVKDERQESTDRLFKLMEVVLPHLEQARQNHIKAVEEKLEDQQSASMLANGLAEQIQKRKSVVKDLNRGTSISAKTGMAASKIRNVMPRIKAFGAFHTVPPAEQIAKESLAPPSPNKTHAT